LHLESVHIGRDILGQRNESIPYLNGNWALKSTQVILKEQKDNVVGTDQEVKIRSVKPWCAYTLGFIATFLLFSAIGVARMVMLSHNMWTAV
jgi:hypothetical protein